MQAITNLIPKKVAYIPIRGPINTQMTQQVSTLLKKVPSNAQALAVVISSNTGSFSQAMIIAQKLRAKANEKKISLFTFGEEFATNSGFLLLMSGHTIFADKTTVLGGLENGNQKMNLGEFSKYLKEVTYTTSESFAAQSTSNGPYSEKKSKQMKDIFEQFSGQASKLIQSYRTDKMKNEVDLGDFFTGVQAKEKGLIDGIGRIYNTMPVMFPKASLKLIKETPFQRAKAELNKVQFSNMFNL